MSLKKLFRKVTDWEAWPFSLLYAPIVPYWIWITLKSRAIFFFTASNPKITFGGMTGESKSQQYEILPKAFLPKTVVVNKNTDWAIVERKIQEADLKFPLILKLDFGEQGMCMRKVTTIENIKSYHEQVPYHFLIQEFSPYDLEVSVFYTRLPSQVSGQITGFLEKVPMFIIGDGNKSVLQHIQHHPKAKKYAEEMMFMHQENLGTIIPSGEQYQLSFAGNHNRGAQFNDLKDFITPELRAHFDKISIAHQDFFYGRYDIKCASVQDLTQGKNFHILEYNGCGAEPNHFYDTGYTLIGAYKEILKHWKILYQVCKENNQRGIKAWPFWKGYKFIKYCTESLKEMKAMDKKLKL